MELFDLQPYAGKRICVAISGGRDSVALLHAFLLESGAYGITVSALTCEHGIRGEASRADLAFVARLCAGWGVPLRIFRADVPALAAAAGKGLEETGREWRYACFRSVLDAGEADAVATAHHRGDYAETLLFRLARGTSLAGLNAFPEQEGIVRPLLFTPRARIDAYVREHGLEYTEDGSNADERFTRNYLRHTVLPALERALPGAADHLVEFAVRASGDDAYLFSLAEKEIAERDGGFCVPCRLPDPLFFRACLLAMKRCGLVRGYTAENFAEIGKLRAVQGGKFIMLPQGVRAVREGGDAVFYRPQPRWTGEIPFAIGTWRDEPFRLMVKEGILPDALYADFDAFPAGCVIRVRREGDMFTPFGGRRKTLKKFLTDKKIPARTGSRLPLVAKGSEVYAVCGVEIADAVKVTKNTVRTVSLHTSLRTPERVCGGKKKMHSDCERVLLTEEEIAQKVKEAAAWLDERFAGEVPVAVCNLKGSVVFFCDLLRAMKTNVQMEFMAVGSYGNAAYSVSPPKIKQDLSGSVEGRDVILVEDIVDSGNTLVTLRAFLKERGARSLTVVVLLDKPSRRVTPAEADYTCFSIEDAFVVGYGLDYAERYRNLPYIGVLRREIYEKA